MNSNTMSPEGSPSGRLRQSILVVEDEFLIRWMLSEELRSAGYHVIEACDASEALSAMKAVRPDLVISDVRMPGPLDGLDLLAWVKENLGALPMIIISDHLHPEQALVDGAVQFVAKPYRFDTVLEAVANGLAGKL